MDAASERGCEKSTTDDRCGVKIYLEKKIKTNESNEHRAANVISGRSIGIEA